MSKSLHIKGLKKLLNDLKSLGDEGEQRISQTTEANAQELAVNAINYAPYDYGTLRQNILAREVGPMTWKVYANAFGNAPYSAYMEFGTGGLVEVPTELKSMAIKFKGKGIKKIDLRPRPFLYPAFVGQKSQYIKDLEGDLRDLTKI